MKLRHVALGAGLIAAALAGPIQAEPFRYALRGPVLTMDPHASADFVTQMVLLQIYDPLVGKDQNLQLEPALATRWQQTDATTWRFALRPGVRFHGGEPFTAADVKFSIERSAPGGMFKIFLSGIKEARVVDDLTIDLVTTSPDPLLPRKLSTSLIMSKAWAEKNGSEKVTSITGEGSDRFAVRNTNGTGMFRLKSSEPGVRVVLERNPAWWGTTDSNVTEATYNTISSGPTRVAALLSGAVDLVADLPLPDIDRVRQDPNLKVLQAPELRMVQLEMDAFRDAPLETWDKAGQPLARNPWRDVRVRKAVAHAVDGKAIVERVMRGLAVPAGIPSAAGIAGYQPDLDVRPAFDPDRAKALLAEAGYPDGFKATLLCPNDRYVNDEAICRAVSGMLARVGIDAPVDAKPWAQFVQRLIKHETSFHLVGAAPDGQDTMDTLRGVWMTRQGDDGFYNWSRWSNREFDAVVERLKTEFDPARRTQLYREAIVVARDNQAAVWLHSQVIVWGLRKNVDASIRPDSYVMLRTVKVGK